MKYSFKIIVILFTALFLLQNFCISLNAADFPDKYETQAKTPVLNQKNNPLCWAYSCADMLSINAIKNGYVENGNTVFSAPMIARAEFDGHEHRHSGGSAWYRCYGGIDYALMAAISGKGLLYSSDYPTVNDADTADVSELYHGESYVDSVKIIDVSELSNKERTNKIKELITEYGAVNTDAFICDYNSVTKIAKILPYDNTQISHSVLLVGWDDTKYTDTGTGAFLMKNTWGEKWGDCGYAWISYNSEFGRHVCSANVVIDKNTSVLTHTETPYLSGTVAEVIPSGEFGAVNVFEISEKISLYKAGVFTNEKEAYLLIKVYKNPSDINNLLNTSPTATAEGKADGEGYYTLDLNKQIELDENDTVAALYIIRSGKNYYVYSEYSDPDFEMAVTNIKSGQSYLYDYGKLKEPKGNYIGTLIGKTDHKEEPVPETETYAESAEITQTQQIQTETTIAQTDVSLPSETVYITENVIIDITETESETFQTETQSAPETEGEGTSAVKTFLKTVFIIAVIIVVLFILLVLALIAASKKKKV